LPTFTAVIVSPGSGRTLRSIRLASDAKSAESGRIMTRSAGKGPSNWNVLIARAKVTGTIRKLSDTRACDARDTEDDVTARTRSTPLLIGMSGNNLSILLGVRVTRSAGQARLSASYVT
jgi:hypothetical protein